MAERMFKQPGVMNAQQHFSHVPSAQIERSTFDRSHAYKTTFDAGKLIPIFVDEVLPGDTFNLQLTGVARLATPLRPIMDNIYLDVHYFFVPNRLVWDEWENFCGQRENPDDDPNAITHPVHSLDMTTIGGQVADYMGLPKANVATQIEVNSLPFRAYQLIWNEWYRDENLQDSIVINKGSGTTVGSPLLLPRGKRKDYFTSALPWPQKGDPVVIPLGDVAPVRGIAVPDNGPVWLPTGLGRETGGTTVDYATNSAIGNDPATPVWFQQDPANPGFPLVWADLADATAITINDLRTAFQIQRLLERDARGGTRYPEVILSHFGVRSPDARLQRPEYLGGNVANINISPIAATFANAEVAQGDLGGVGTGVNKSGFFKSFTEHGFVIGLASARADLTYQNGVERMWWRRTRYDYYWPALSHLGEQAIHEGEIYMSPTQAENFRVFGYQERYAEYRYKPSRVTALFASAEPASLDVWHLSEEFSAPPLLNESFIVENPPIDRVIAVPSEPHFIMDCWFRFRCTRPMPIYSVPGLIDHF